MRKPLSSVLLALILIGVLTFVFNVKPVKSEWTGTVYIRADGSVDPPTAPIITYDNVTYTLIGNISSNGYGIVVERDNIIIDGAGYTVQSSPGSGGTGIYLSHRSNVTIKKTRVLHFYWGVLLNYSSNNVLSENDIFSIIAAIKLTNSNSNTLSFNYVVSLQGAGIALINSRDNTIAGNNVTNSSTGVFLQDSSNNIISLNNITNNLEHGIFLDNSSWNSLCGNSVTNNTCGNGVALSNSPYNDLHDNIISYNEEGFYLQDSSYNSLYQNTINNNGGGIRLSGSYNNLYGNTVAHNWNGLLLSQASNNTIYRNTISNNVEGINVSPESFNNNLYDNDIMNNEYGIETWYSSDNVIFHNNFINNTYQAVNQSPGYINIWDDGYPSGGNYWSDYTGVDKKSGPNQDQPGSDGIGDTPYIIDANNTDRYPLMNPWTPTPSYVQGIDVSHYQGSIDWAQVYNAGYRFAFVKASEGVGWADPNFRTNIEGGCKAGLLMGAYHFARPDLGNNPADEAKYFVEVVSEYLCEGYLRPVLDLETGASLGKEALTNWVHIWMETVKNETGIEPILYVNSNYANNHLNASIAKYNLWIAHWTYDLNTPPNTGIWDRWDFWQYSDKGSVPGIVGNVDLDLFNGDLQRLRREFILSNERTFHVSWEDKTYPITILSNSSVTHLIFNQSLAQISFKISGKTGLQGYCNITIPKSLIKGEPWTVKINGTTIDFQSTSNQTHSFIYFTYTFASTLEVTIEGTWVIPEFPTHLTLLALTMLATIYLILIKKKEQRKTKT